MLDFWEKSFQPKKGSRKLETKIDGNCPICDEENETLSHLFNLCDVVSNVWSIIEVNVLLQLIRILVLLPGLNSFRHSGIVTINYMVIP